MAMTDHSRSALLAALIVIQVMAARGRKRLQRPPLYIVK